MNKARFVLFTVLVAGFGLFTAGSSAAQQPIYGSQLMTPQERLEHRERMREMSPEDRATYRAQHHEQMQQRAKDLGRELPSQPAPGISGYGPGRGYGWGPRYDAAAPGGPRSGYYGLRRGPGFGSGPGYGLGPGMGPGYGSGYGPGGWYPGYGRGLGYGWGPGSGYRPGIQPGWQ